MDLDQESREMQREYLDFLDDEEDQGVYRAIISRMLDEGQNRLIVDMVDLRRKNRKRAQGLLKNPVEELRAFQSSLKELVAVMKPDLVKDLPNLEYFIGLEGTFGSKHVSPRTLTSHLLGNLVCCDGIVTKCTSIKPKVVRSVHYCPATKRTMERRYTDLTSSDPFPSSASYPTKDDDGNPLETEYGLSTYKDHQIFTIQEMPEKAPAGQLPRSVDVMVENDLVDACKPGDRVQVVGEYRCLPSKQGNVSTGMFRSIVLANNVITMSKSADVEISKEEFTKIRSFAKQNNRNVFDILARSLAPSIHGHDYIKKALLCMLLGGTEKVLPNGTRLRGDINILLIGDPSVAKSQLLRYVLGTAPRAVATTGRGSSGVGLTAAVTTDQETGDRRLEAGAMVLADRGVVCIDEFDKMTDADRTAIHEVMEQGRVTVSKAGIQAQLNARCAVLAAANPVYGRYDQYKTPMENIGLPDSLLSRFDCIFVMLDTLDADADRRIADHVVQVHRYKENTSNSRGGGGVEPVDSLNTASTAAGNSNGDGDDVTEDGSARTLSIYEKNDVMRIKGSNQRVLTVEFMKKYIHMAKMVQPNLTQEACEVIAEEYARLRSQDALEHEESNVTSAVGGSSKLARTQPVTARALETLIRLATAHAKARMSRKIDARDAYAAIDLVQFAYFKRVLEKEQKRRRRPSTSRDADPDSEAGSDHEDVEEPLDDSEDTTARPTGDSGRKKRRVEPTASATDPGTVASIDTTAMSSQSSAPVTLSTDRMKLFKSTLSKMFQEKRANMVPVDDILGFVNGKLDTARDPHDRFTRPEVDSALNTLTSENSVMLAGGAVYWI